MSTRSTILYSNEKGKEFHLYEELLDSTGIFLTIFGAEFEASAERLPPDRSAENPRVILTVKIPRWLFQILDAEIRKDAEQSLDASDNFFDSIVEEAKK